MRGSTLSQVWLPLKFYFYFYNIINIKQKLDEYKEKLKELQARFEDLKSLKSTFAFFVNPFIHN